MNVEFELDGAENYSVTILDLNGRQVSSTVKSGNGQAGLNKVNFNNISLTTGLYIIKVDTDSAVSVQKVIVQN